MTNTQKLAAIANREGVDTQALLSEAVATWRQAGLHVVGVLAQDHDGDSYCSAGFLRDLVTGQTYSIQLATTPADTECHLDANGVEQASKNLLDQIPQADVVVLSKFGKLEASHKGLWAVIQAAIAAGKPLLTTVSATHADDWQAFAPTAARLAASSDDIHQWGNDTIRSSSQS